MQELESEVCLKGLSSIDSKIEPINKPPYTYLARTNATLFDQYLNAVQKGYQCSLAANVEDTVELLTAMYFLWSNKRSLIKDDRVSGFREWQDLINFANDEKDQDMLRGIAFINSHQSNCLSMLKMIKQAGKIKEHEADIIFTTAHKAKGREWNKVVLADDFRLNTISEKNLYYVALTRAKMTLDYPTEKLKAG